MPSCAPDYANIGYKEYFNAGAPGVSYSNYSNYCVQKCIADSRTVYYGRAGGSTGRCSQFVCSQTCSNASLYGPGDTSMNDDCSQYARYSNCTNYTRNVSGAASFLSPLGLNQTLIDNISDVPTSITAITHLRDKLSALINIKPKQNSVDANISADVSDATFNDNNPATAEVVLAKQYNALKTKLDSFWNALKNNGTTLGTPSSDSVKTRGDVLLKNSITALKNDLVTVANACSQTYSNYQNGSPTATQDTYANGATYIRTATYTDLVCSQGVCTNYYQYSNSWANYYQYINCYDYADGSNVRYFNSNYWNYSNG